MEAVSESSEPWSFDDLPSNGEGKMPTYLVRDTKMIKGDKDTLLREDPLTVPIVIGMNMNIVVGFRLSNYCLSRCYCSS